MNKKFRVFIAESKDTIKLFETVRMSLGIALKGHTVTLYISNEAPLKSLESDKKSELEEFLQYIKQMGGDFLFVDNIEELIIKSVSEKVFHDIIVL